MQKLRESQRGGPKGRTLKPAGMEGPGPKIFLTKALGQEKATEREDLLNLTKPTSTSAKPGASGSASTPGAGPEASWVHLTSKSLHRSPWKKHRAPAPTQLRPP